MEFSGSGTYRQYASRDDKYYLLIPVIGAFVYGGMWALAIPLLIYILWVKLRCTFTNKILITENSLEIEFTRLYIRKIRRFDIADTTMLLHHYEDDVRRPPYEVLDIIQKGKVKYQVDSREGYTRATLVNCVDSFVDAKAMLNKV